MNTKIICRICGQNHLTVKCTTNKIQTNNNNNNNNNSARVCNNNKIYNNNINRDNKIFHSKRQNYKHSEVISKPQTIKLSELPDDITDNELWELTKNWGNIIKIKVIKYPHNCIAYIIFKYEEQANYFIKALHKTKFDNSIISVIKVSQEIDLN